MRENYDKHIPIDKLKELFEYFDERKNNYLDTTQVIKFNAFIFKRFPRLGDTINETNSPSGIPNSIFNLTKLKLLDLSYQSIKHIPDEIEKLENLERLILKSCIFLESISPKLAKLNITQIDLSSCSSLKTPPREICRRGTFSIMGYLRRLSSGYVKCKRTKLMLVGLGEAGKTSLLNALMRKKENQERPLLTDGIDIKEWSIGLPDNSQLVFSMWDFGIKL